MGQLTNRASALALAGLFRHLILLRVCQRCAESVQFQQKVLAGVKMPTIVRGASRQRRNGACVVVGVGKAAAVTAVMTERIFSRRRKAMSQSTLTEPSYSWKARFVLFAAIALAGAAADLWTKHWVFSRGDMFAGSEWWLIEGHVGIQKSLNEGALFGMGQGKVSLFAAFSVVAAFAIPLWLFRFRAAQDRWITVILGFVMAGVIGNFYDRVGLSALSWDQFDPARGGQTVYAVRDWILFQWNSQYVWPNFNLADAFLVCGACSLFVRSLIQESRSPALLNS